jgi:hypothetical protein
MFPAGIRTWARAALLAAGIAAAVPAVHASVDQPAQTNGAGNLATYTGCATGLAIASTLPQAWAALAICFKIVADEWNRML